MTFKLGNFKVRITIKKDGGIVIEIEPWKRKGGLTPPAPNLNVRLTRIGSCLTYVFAIADRAGLNTGKEQRRTLKMVRRNALLGTLATELKLL